MRRRTTILIVYAKPGLLLRAGLLMLLALGMAGCWEAEHNLPGGWKQVSWTGYGYMILKTEWDSTEIKVVIGPTVEQCRVLGTVITGHVVAEPPESDPYMTRPTSGYFVVETATGRVWQGLDEAAWRQRLREVGVAEAPRLKRLSMSDWKCTGE